jgi:hypothetical protein
LSYRSSSDPLFWASRQPRARVIAAVDIDLGDDTTKRSVTRGTQRAATVLRALGITNFDPPMPPQQGQTIV